MTLATFYRHVSVTNDEVIAMLGGVKLQMVLGDIVQESTDAIINTTDFSNNHAGMIVFLLLVDFKYTHRKPQREICVCYINLC